MNNRRGFSGFMMPFFVCTTCISLLQGVLGMIFFSEQKLGYEAFFAPPLLGLISSLLGVVNYSAKELSVSQVIFRRAIHLFLIEGMVFALNYISGTLYAPFFSWALGISVGLLFVLVHVILWLMDRRIAMEFNRQLKAYQNRADF